MTSSSAGVEPALTETVSVPRRFDDLRGVQWRIDLGIMPSGASIDDLRRVTANSRRRYAAMRRQLLIDPHVSKDGTRSPDLVIDNPLSQNPDSMWGRFFKNAELERMVDQDLTRLYPEHGSYFQTSACQNMLRRILLLWCLRHPAYGYRQGMHELLAPLLYVLHVDVERLSEVRKTYEDHFTDQFDGFSFYEDDLKFDFKKFPESVDDGSGSGKGTINAGNHAELDPKIQNVILLSDAYGAEGELGVVLSEKFLEHDAYCMFDALLSGSGGVVAMAEFFSPSPFSNSHSGLPPVIEASATLYHLLSLVDSSLHSHLVELGVEPQYFALRWLRVLFGREFALEDLLVIWDEIFACENTRLNDLAKSDLDFSSGVLDSTRGAFISAFAVSMILHLRSSLLATENATSCLQRLLNFPEDVRLEKLIRKAKSLQSLAVHANSSTPLLAHTGLFERSKSAVIRGHTQSLDSTSPRTPLNLVHDSYWEEKWRVLHKEEERKKDSSGIPTKKGWSEKVKMRLSRTQSGPSSSEAVSRKKDPKLPVRRNLLADLARQLGADEDADEILSIDHSEGKEPDVEHFCDYSNENSACSTSPICLSGNAGSEENSSIFSDPPSPTSGVNNHGNESGRSSVASNSSIDENEQNDDGQSTAEVCGSDPEDSTPAVSKSPDENIATEVSSQNDDSAGKSLANLKERKPLSSKSLDENIATEVSGQNDDSAGKSLANLKERKPLSSKFQWIWKFARGGGEGVSEKGQAVEENKGFNGGTVQENNPSIPTADGVVMTSAEQSKGESVDQMMVTLKNLGQSMLDNIQVIESVFQQDRPQAGHSKNVLVGKGQVTAMAALKELRKISNLLSEM